MAQRHMTPAQRAAHDGAVELLNAYSYLYYHHGDFKETGKSVGAYKLQSDLIANECIALVQQLREYSNMEEMYRDRGDLSRTQLEKYLASTPDFSRWSAELRTEWRGIALTIPHQQSMFEAREEDRIAPMDLATKMLDYERRRVVEFLMEQGVGKPSIWAAIISGEHF